MNLFRSLQLAASAPVARERLQILLEYERKLGSQIDLFAVLREEILAVVSRHIVDPEKVQVTVDRGAKFSTLGVNIEIPNPGGKARTLPTDCPVLQPRQNCGDARPSRKQGTDDAGRRCGGGNPGGSDLVGGGTVGAILLASKGRGSVALITSLFRVGLIAAVVLGAWLYVQQRDVSKRRTLDDRETALMAGFEEHVNAPRPAEGVVAATGPSVALRGTSGPGTVASLPRDPAAAEPASQSAAVTPPAALESATSPPQEPPPLRDPAAAEPASQSAAVTPPAALESAMSPPQEPPPLRDLAAAEPASQSAAVTPPAALESATSPPQDAAAASAAAEPASQSAAVTPPATLEASRRRTSRRLPPQSRSCNPPRSLHLPRWKASRRRRASRRRPPQSRLRNPPRSLHLPRWKRHVAARAAVGRRRAGLAIRRGHSTCRAGKRHVAAAGGAAAAPSDRRRAGLAIRRGHSTCRAGKRHVSARAAVRRRRAGLAIRRGHSSARRTSRPRHHRKSRRQEVSRHCRHAGRFRSALRRRRVRSLLLRCFVGVRPRKEELCRKNNARAHARTIVGMVDRYVLHQRGWNGDRCRCNCDSFRALVARGGISANCPQEPSIGIRPVVAQAQRKLALPTGTNWGGPSCYRAASRID